MAKPVDSSQAQASEVHETTGDASSSPTAASDEQATRERTGRGHAPASEQKRNPDAGQTRIVSDQGDEGGPVDFRDEPQE